MSVQPAQNYSQSAYLASTACPCVSAFGSGSGSIPAATSTVLPQGGTEQRVFEMLGKVIEQVLDFAFKLISSVIGGGSGAGSALAGSGAQSQAAAKAPEQENGWLDSIANFGKSAKDAVGSIFGDISFGDILGGVAGLFTGGAGGGLWSTVGKWASKIF